jgi:hypothetical protein
MWALGELEETGQGTCGNRRRMVMTWTASAPVTNPIVKKAALCGQVTYRSGTIE